MHGHGEKPFSCPHEGCERSEPGNGFPRKWNLADHMRRVHNLTGHSTCNGNSSSVVIPLTHGSADSQTGSKRKATTSKKLKQRRDSKNIAIAGSKSSSKSMCSQPATSLPECNQFFGLENTSGNGFYPGCAPMMQASRSMNAVDQLQPYTDSLRDFDVDPLRLHPTLSEPQMGFTNPGHDLSGTGLEWPLLMEHVCIYQPLLTGGQLCMAI